MTTAGIIIIVAFVVAWATLEWMRPREGFRADRHDTGDLT